MLWKLDAFLLSFRVESVLITSIQMMYNDVSLLPHKSVLNLIKSCNVHFLKVQIKMLCFKYVKNIFLKKTSFFKWSFFIKVNLILDWKYWCYIICLCLKCWLKVPCKQDIASFLFQWIIKVFLFTTCLSYYDVALYIPLLCYCSMVDLCNLVSNIC